MQISISKNFIRTSPDKIRPIINLVRGWKVTKAITELDFVNKQSTNPVIEILKSSVAASKDKDVDEDELYIKMIKCDEGPRLKRRRIIHRGRATTINKRMSHISLTISDENNSENKSIKASEKENKDNKSVSKSARRKNGSKG